MPDARTAWTSRPFAPAPLVLAGRHVRLEPLTRAHLVPLRDVGNDPRIFRWMPRAYFCDDALAAAWIDEAVAETHAGRAVAFVTCALDADGATSRPVGSTRYFDLRPEHRALEIGWTWIAAPWQRTAVNTEAKLLMLTQAFEGWGALRVQLKTDSRNEASRRAMERLGCRFEGILRNHMLLPDGSHRHSAFYSIVADEWPAVRAHIEDLLARRG